MKILLKLLIVYFILTINIAEARPKIGLVLGGGGAAGVVDHLAAGHPVQPLILATHLPVPGGGGVDDVEAVIVLQVEITDFGNELRRQVGIAQIEAVGQQVAARAIPDGLVVVTKEVMLRPATQTTARTRCFDKV